ncbi:tyrosine-type recombinase/integrase [Streptomyces sp. NPDC005774]|uniref:tyrosine-type recombinase/integrase n=1 Tax=Streptomyces sp. NPDC005774 TaxID=3364728 RepID=UPI00367D49E0
MQRTLGLRRIRFHGLRHPMVTLLVEQGVELVVFKGLLGHAHIGATATVYAHVRLRLRLRLQRNVIEALDIGLDGITNAKNSRVDGDGPPPLTPLAR